MSKYMSKTNSAYRKLQDRTAAFFTHFGTRQKLRNKFSGLSSFLHRGVEYLLSRLYSLNSVCQQSNELQPIPNCVNNTYNNAYNNSSICINPTHFNQGK